MVLGRISHFGFLHQEVVYTHPFPVDPGHYLKMSVRSDGAFTMTNERNGFTKS
jgi:hypothetical protein